MRVLVLTNMFPPDADGGYELWCQDMVVRWQAAGHEVAVLTGDVRLAGTGEAEDPGLDVRRELRLYWQDHELLSPPPWERLRRERHNQRRLEATMRRFRPDVVSVWAMGAMSLGLLVRTAELGVPLVSVLCDEWPVYGPAADAWTRLFLPRPGWARLARVVTGLPCRLPDLDRTGPACFASEALLERCRRSSPWAFPQATVVPLGIDGREFQPAPGAAQARRAGWSWRVLHVGRLDPRKGIDTVVDAFAGCPAEATLALLGSGSAAYRQELEGRVRRLGLGGRVQFDACPRAALADRYRAADVAVFAPLWEEPFGLVPLEAMACGTPLVASPTGGSREFLVDGENCLAFPSGDVEALGRALHTLAADPALRSRLVENGLRTAARFDTDRLAGELAERHRGAVQAVAGRSADADRRR